MAATGVPKFKASAGTLLKYGTYAASSPSYDHAFSIRKYGGLPETKVDSWEITRVDAVNADGTPDLEKYKAFGKKDRGELMFTIASEDDEVAAVFALEGVLSSWQITFGLALGQSVPATLSFAGAITQHKASAGEKDEALHDITITLSGGLVFTAGS